MAPGTERVRGAYRVVKTHYMELVLAMESANNLANTNSHDRGKLLPCVIIYLT